MEIQEYIKLRKELLEALIDFIDSDTDDNLMSNDILYEHLKNLNQEQNQEKLNSLFCIIIQISHNHHRNVFFNSKIDKIINYLSQTIKQTMSNSEIFNLFKSNKKILLYLINHQIVTIDKNVLNSLLNNQINRRYFYPEIKPLISVEEQKKIFPKGINIELFEKKRQKGENDSHLSELIRNDSIVEFIEYVNLKNIDLSNSKIKPSIYEMNPLLNEREASLIEYSAFYGSIRIFQYLQNNNVELNSSLWIYSIHSNNPELIDILENEKVKPPNDKFETCLVEAIKCHHNNIAEYIINSLLTNEDYLSNDDVLESIFRYYNYSFFPENLVQDSIFFFLCQFNYTKIVDFIIEMKNDEFLEKIIKSVNIQIFF